MKKTKPPKVPVPEIASKSGREHIANLEYVDMRPHSWFKRENRFKKNEYGLTERQEAFCQWYAISGDMITAYSKAGYAEMTDEKMMTLAFRLLYRVNIKERIMQIREQRMAEITKKYEHTIEEIIQNLWKVYHTAMEAGEFANATKALELLGKNLNMFVEQKNVKVQSFVGSDDPEEMKRQIAILADAAGIGDLGKPH